MSVTGTSSPASRPAPPEYRTGERSHVHLHRPACNVNAGMKENIPPWHATQAEQTRQDSNARATRARHAEMENGRGDTVS